MRNFPRSFIHRSVVLTVVAIAATIASTIASTSPGSAATKTSKKSVKEAESIEDYFGGNNTDQQKRITRKVNESIQKCMKGEGFEYKIPPDTSVQFPTGTDSASQQAFVKKYGYGISTTIDVNSLKPGNSDPNAAIRSKLSPADQKAYDKALIGGTATGPTGDPKSCITKALSFLGDLTKLTTLFTKYESEVTKRIDSNPKVVAAMKKWSACMKDKGFTFAKDGDIVTDISNRLSKIIGTGGFGGLFGGASPDPAKIDKVALSKLQKEEIATATQDFSCTEKHLGLRKTLKRDLDRDFITANQSDVDGFRDKLNG